MTDKTFALHDNLMAQGKVVVLKGASTFNLFTKIEKIAMGEIKYKPFRDLYSLNGAKTFGSGLKYASA